MDYDVIVLGVGSAGSRAAATAVKEGAKVLAVEAGDELGGLCILRGCMPTKTLLETAHRVHEIRDAERFGIDAPSPTVNFTAQMERMRRLVARFKRAKIGGINSGGYELIHGRPRFTDSNAIEVDGKRYTAKAFVVATGSVVRPFGWEVPEGVPLLTSDDMFLLEAPPRRASVHGAGAVGLEFAQWLARMGTEVTLVVRSALLHRSDPEMGEALTRALAEEMTVRSPCAVQGFERTDGGALLRGTLADGSDVEVEVDMVLNATGRVPNLEGLGLDAVGLEGDVELSDGFRSQVQHVYFAGDVTGKNAILHEANFEGEIAGRNSARFALGQGEQVSYDPAIPPLSVLFTDPPVAVVGRTPQQLDAEGIAYETATKAFPSQGRGIVVGARHGFLRLVAAPGGGEVLGCQVFGPRADDLIHIPAAVMQFGGTAKQMFKIPWYHPTLAEAFVEVCRELSR